MIRKQIQSISGELENTSTYRFEDALNLTGFGKYNVYMTILCGGIGMATILELLGFSYILPAAQCDLQLTLTQKGWLAAMPFLGLTISQYFWGLMADTRGRKKILMLSMFIGSIFSMISSFSPTLPIFAALKFCASAFISASNSIIFPYFGEFMPKKYLDSMISIVSSVLVVSTAFTSIIALGVQYIDFRIPMDFIGIEYRSWRLLIVLYALPFIVVVLAMFKAAESPKFLMTQGRNDEALEILRSMYAVNTGNKKSDFPVKTLILDESEVLNLRSKDVGVWETMLDQTAPLFKPPLVVNLLKFMVLAFGVYTTNATVIWLPNIIDRYQIGMTTGTDLDNKNFCDVMAVRSELNRNNTHMVNTTENLNSCGETLNNNTFLMMIVLSFVLAAFNLFLAGILRIVNKKAVLVVVYGIGLVACFCMDWVYNKILVWILIVIFETVGVLIGVVNTYGIEVIPAKYRSMAICLILIIGRIGSVVGTNVVGYLIEVYCPGKFYFYGIIFFVCLIVSISLPNRNTKKGDKGSTEWNVSTATEITKC